MENSVKKAGYKKYYLITAVIFLGMFFCFKVFAVEDGYIIEFLNSRGYEVLEQPIECERVSIPKPFDEVYKGYNEIQKSAGFDLLPYAGKKGVRYTYEVKNYPGKIEGVRANVIIIEGKIVGGDICTVRLDGFMHGIILMQK